MALLCFGFEVAVFPIFTMVNQLIAVVPASLC